MCVLVCDISGCWTFRLTDLFLPGLVADGGSEVDPRTALSHAVPAAHEDAEARLLEDVHVVVVGVAHGPAGRVTSRVLAVAHVHVAAVAVRPVLERVVLRQLWATRRRKGVNSTVSFLQSLLSFFLQMPAQSCRSNL